MVKRLFFVCAAVLVGANALGAASAPATPKRPSQRAPVSAMSVDELRRAQAAVDSELEEAKASSDKYGGGLIKKLIEERIEILKTTRALLAQGIVALQTGAPMTTRWIVARPDSARARALQREIENLRRQRVEKRAESNGYAGGLMKEMLEQNIATLNATLATLEAERLKAIYGIFSTSSPTASTQRPDQAESVKPATGSTSATKPAKDAASRLMVPTLTNKRFQDSNYADAIYFDVDWNTSGLPRATRAIKGVLIVSDLFGEPKVSIKWTINKPLTPDEQYRETDIGFDYNKYINEHQWMRSTDLSDMTVMFRAESIIYQDGTQEDFPSR